MSGGSVSDTPEPVEASENRRADARPTEVSPKTRARRVWGLALPGAAGRFPLAGFEALRVERRLVSGNGTTLARVERATLVGRAGTPDIPVLEARVAGDASPAEVLAAALRLPCEVVRTPARARWTGIPRPRRDGR